MQQVGTLVGQGAAPGLGAPWGNDGVEQVAGARRLDQLVGHAGFAPLHMVRRGALGAEQQQAHAGQRGVGVDCRRQRQAAGARQVHVEQRHVVRLAACGALPQQRQGLAGAGAGAGDTPAAQLPFQRGAAGGMVVNDQGADAVAQMGLEGGVVAVHAALIEIDGKPEHRPWR